MHCWYNLLLCGRIYTRCVCTKPGSLKVPQTCMSCTQIWYLIYWYVQLAVLILIHVHAITLNSGDFVSKPNSNWKLCALPLGSTRIEDYLSAQTLFTVLPIRYYFLPISFACVAIIVTNPSYSDVASNRSTNTVPMDSLPAASSAMACLHWRRKWERL